MTVVNIVNVVTVFLQDIRSRTSEVVPQAVVTAWETAARDKWIGDILQETSEDESFVWERFCEKVGMNRGNLS